MKFQDALGKLNESYFFREFTFSTNTFRPDKRTELELADAVVWLDELLIVVQVKERCASFGATPADEENWFRAEVLGKAVSQIGNTIRYLHAYNSIELSNNQGHTFNLANAKAKRIHKLIVYQSDRLLPDAFSSQKFAHDASGDIVHIIRSGHYFGILESLITPAEVEEYLSFRQSLITRWHNAVCDVSEEALVGQFLRNTLEERPSLHFVDLLVALRQRLADTEEWDISRIIHLFSKRRTTPQQSPTDYYETLKELAKLNRTDMSAFKERFHLSMQKAKADMLASPYRFDASTGCGFVFIPLKREYMKDRRKLLEMYTQLNKYDRQLERCVGLTFISEGNETWCDVQWCRLSFPFKENSKLKEILQKNYPFRHMKESRVERYGLTVPPNP